MMMGLAMKKAAAIPMAFGLLFLLAGKALIISKLALILTLIVALKKLKSSSKWVRDVHPWRLSSQVMTSQKELNENLQRVKKKKTIDTCITPVVCNIMIYNLFNYLIYLYCRMSLAR